MGEQVDSAWPQQKIPIGYISFKKISFRLQTPSVNIESVSGRAKITIGEATVDYSDTATKQAAEVGGATGRTNIIPSDKAVTRKDAEGVIDAELRSDQNLCTCPGGVAALLMLLIGSTKVGSTNTKNNDQNNTNLVKITKLG